MKSPINPSISREDYHVHTRYCNHASGEMEEYVLYGIQRNLKVICFLEHYETDVQYDIKNWLNEDELEWYYNKCHQLKETYKNQIEVQCGLELGFRNQESSILILERVCNLLPWDEVGLSYHYYPAPDRDYINLVSQRRVDRILNYFGDQKQDIQKVMFHYFHTIQIGLEKLGPSLTKVCHLDVMQKNFSEIEYTHEISNCIENILILMAKHQLKLEINTGGYDHKGSFYPDKWIVSRALNLGIQVHLGSDSHSPDEVGRDFQRAYQDLLKLSI